MGCRCSERARQIRTAAGAAVRGDFSTTRRELAAASRTFADDARSGALAREARRLAAAKLTRRR